jgi:Animal haem peroxidase
MSVVQAKDTKDVVSKYHGYAVQDRMVSFSTAETPKAAAKPGMYGWLFPELPPLDAKPAALEALGRAMIEADGPQSKTGNSQIPAGFTFLGQFVDHDLTFDTTPLPERVEDPPATTNFRTPALDLDCLYGNGPRVHPFLYRRDGKSFLIGRNEGVTGFDKLDNDLPRNGEGMALVADPRNDENLIVAQLHLAMLKFHNNVVATSGDLDFDEVRRLVTLHYQWIVLNDFLLKVVDGYVLNEVLAGGPQFYKPAEFPMGFAFIPVEFGAAAYRFGHSLIRETYNYNASFPDAHLSSLFALTGPGGEVDFTLPVPANWTIDWNRFFFNELDPPPDGNVSRRVNTMLSHQLGTLLFTPKGETPNLAIRNLRRGNAFRLPSGQSVAAAIGLSAQALKPEEIRAAGPDGSVAAQNGFLEQTPLWYYILKEADLRADGQHLGPVGSRILSEVFVGLLKRPGALLHKDTDFRPSLGRRKKGEFTMLDLLERAAEPLPDE